MEREPEAFIEQALDELYEKAVKEGVAPVFTVDGKTWDEWALEEWGPPDESMKLTVREAQQMEEALGETPPDEP